MLFGHIHSTKEKLYGLFNLHVQLDVTIGDCFPLSIIKEIFNVIIPMISVDCHILLRIPARKQPPCGGRSRLFLIFLEKGLLMFHIHITTLWAIIGDCLTEHIQYFFLCIRIRYPRFHLAVPFAECFVCFTFSF